MPDINDPITVVIATDSFLMGDGLTAILAGESDVEVIGRCRALGDLTRLVAELTPQALIMSVRSQVVTTQATVAVARRLRATHPEIGIVVISDRTSEFALELLRGGSAGIAFLLDAELPGIEPVIGALHGLRIGQPTIDRSILDCLIRRGDESGINELTPREADVLERIAHGFSNKAIAANLHISVKAIEKGITAIFSKLGPFNQGYSDRRVSAALVFLRAQTDPFREIADTA